MDSNQPRDYRWHGATTPDYDNDTMPIGRAPQYNGGEASRGQQPVSDETYRLSPAHGRGELPSGAVIRGAGIPDRRNKKQIAIPLMFGVIFLLIAAIAVVIFMPGSKSDDTEEAAPYQQQHLNIPAGKADNTLSYGEWDGQYRYGQPHGNGTLKFTVRRLVSQFDPKATVAQPGDYVIGEYDNGQLLHGRLYRTNGTTADILCAPPARDSRH